MCESESELSRKKFKQTTLCFGRDKPSSAADQLIGKLLFTILGTVLNEQTVG